MNHPRLPRSLIILLFILVAGTTLAGSLRSFASTQAADDIEGSSQNGQSAAAVLAPTLTPTTRSTLGSPTLAPTITAPTATLPPSPTGSATPTPTTAATLAPTSTPMPEPVYITDMSGIITLGILVVVVILVGVTWGGRRVPRKKGQK